MNIDGKKIAEAVYARLPKEAVTLGILVGESTPAIDSFVKIKARAAARLGVTLVREELPLGATTDDAIAAVLLLAGKTDGIIVQLPLPQQLDVEAVLAAIPGGKDVDGISTEPLVLPPVAEAVREIIDSQGILVRGMRAVVVGAGRLVGKPCASLLKDLGAEVIVLTHGDALSALKEADIVVLGAGVAGMVLPEHLKVGVALIDAGTSDSSNGEGAKKIAGDADPSCAALASVFTPVPGGVGPIAVAMIFKNLYTLAARARPLHAD